MNYAHLKQTLGMLKLMTGDRHLIVAIILITTIFTSAQVSDKNESQYSRQMISNGLLMISTEQASTGYLSSPNYPQTYPTNFSSTASLRIKDNSKFDVIRITFLDINLDLNNHCEGESLVFYLGEELETGEMKFRKIYIVCGSKIPEPLVISTKQVLIQFMSDAFASGKKRGFLLKFEFLNYKDQLYGGCSYPNLFRCRNRRCIPNSLKCDGRDDCGDASDEDISTPCRDLPTIPYRIDYSCGNVESLSLKSAPAMTDSKLQNRIVGGGKVRRPNKLPFQVSIQLSRVEPVSVICGGTLIHPLFIITAAHCFSGFNRRSGYKFVLGSNNLEVEGELSSGVQVRHANFITLYPGSSLVSGFDNVGYRVADMTNDLAIVELNAPVELTSSVMPACLPYLDETVQADRECFTSGYGETRGTGGAFHLKSIPQILQTVADCRSAYHKLAVLDYTMICAVSDLGNGPCSGDSGGPLFCLDQLEKNTKASRLGKKPGEIIRYLPLNKLDATQSLISEVDLDELSFKEYKYTVHGLTSFAAAGNSGGGFCGLGSQVPTIYARVSTKVDWILSQIKMAANRLGQNDIRKDSGNRAFLFGYMFRHGMSQNENYTRPMTVVSD